MDLDTALMFADLTGHGVAVSEECALRVASSVLLAKSKHHHFGFWGKVRGHAADYLVAVCHDEDMLDASTTTYYFSTDGAVSFSCLPALTSADAKSADRLQSWLESITGCFMGDPAFEYRVVDPTTGAEHRLLESQRLAALIAAHTRRCRVVPRGAYALRRVVPPAAKKADGHAARLGVIRNSTFEGLDRLAAGRLDSYVHLRPQTRPRAAVETPEAGSASERFDCLDPISEDVPIGQWNLKYDAARNCVYAHNLSLDGAVFFHVPGTAVHGNIYIGDGAINSDLAFMVVG